LTGADVVERIRSAKVVVEVDTNKQTILESFDDFDKLADWLVENEYIDLDELIERWRGQ
jgi:hypothetical protein